MDTARRDRLLKLVRSLPPASGVYVMRNVNGEEIYVGKAKNLRVRVRQYFDASRLDPKSAALVEDIHDIQIIETESEVEALLLESRLIKDIQPKYNVSLKGTSYPLVEVTAGEDFPRVLITRDRKTAASRYYGPFVNGGELRAALPALRRIFRFCMCPSAVEPKPKRPVRPCLDYHVGLCLAPCASKIGRDEYRAMIRRFENLLRGSGREKMLAELEKAMQGAAELLNYEEAARLRDEKTAIESLEHRGDLDSPQPPSMPRVNIKAGLAELAELLKLPAPPRRIEGLDLAHLSGREAAGSIVIFVDGRPATGFYRHFLIRQAPGNDDYAQMAEVVTRRARRLAEDKIGGPDLLLLDGGPGQLSAAARAIAEAPQAGRPAAYCSLSKRAEIIHTSDGRRLSLPRNSTALRILQHVRDEAHRFAGQYHRKRREMRIIPKDNPAKGRKHK